MGPGILGTQHSGRAGRPPGPGRRRRAHRGQRDGVVGRAPTWTLRLQPCCTFTVSNRKGTKPDNKMCIELFIYIYIYISSLLNTPSPTDIQCGLPTTAMAATASSPRLALGRLAQPPRPQDRTQPGAAGHRPQPLCLPRRRAPAGWGLHSLLGLSGRGQWWGSGLSPGQAGWGSTCSSAEGGEPQQRSPRSPVAPEGSRR